MGPHERANPPELATAQRVDAWDYARGIGIVLVVYGHVMRGLQPPGVVVLDGTWLGVADFAVYCFHMPLFFVLAGINSAGRLTRSGFLASKLGTVLLPYAVWSVLQGIAQAQLAGATNTIFRLDELPHALVFSPYAQFWFLYVLFLCHFYAWLTGGRTALIALGALLAYVSSLSIWIGFFSVAFRFFAFYALGVLAAPWIRMALRRLDSAGAIAVTGVTAAAAIAGAWHAPGANHTGEPAALAAAVLGTLLVLQLSAALARRGAARWLVTLGRLAMPIYLLHILAGSGVRIGLLVLGITQPSVHFAAGMLAGLLLPVLGYRLSLALGTEKLLGVRADPTIALAR